MIFLWGSIQTWPPSSIKSELAESERSRLNEVSHRGKPSVRTVKRALALLKADEGLGDREIANVLLINAATGRQSAEAVRGGRTGGRHQ